MNRTKKTYGDSGASRPIGRPSDWTKRDNRFWFALEDLNIKVEVLPGWSRCSMGRTACALPREKVANGGDLPFSPARLTPIVALAAHDPIYDQ
jgi:hypothetical protein